MDFLTNSALPHTTVWFLGTLGLLAAYWFYRVAREARAERVPRVAWWAVPGLVMMLYSQGLEQPQPTFFALGAACLLLAEFWPYAYRRSAGRPPATWPVLGLILGAAVVMSIFNKSEQQSFAFAVGLSAVLAGLAGLITAGFWPKPRPASLGFGARWKPITVPEWPDLSVTLTARGAELKNVSRQTLELAGWSPISINGWLMVRDEHGQSLNKLRAGQTAFIPLPDDERGVRVWYAVSGKTSDPRLFRADWVPVHAQNSRILN